VTPQEAIEAAELVEAETAYCRQVGREMYAAGYAAAEADMDARWNRIARVAVCGPSHAELEQKRWGPGGREAFGRPRPADFPGRGAPAPSIEAQAEPELELEAG
jgi:hypothetical protein